MSWAGQRGAGWGREVQGPGAGRVHYRTCHLPWSVLCSEVPTGSAVCVYQGERGTGDNNNGLFDIFRRRYINNGMQIDNPSGFNVSCVASWGGFECTRALAAVQDSSPHHCSALMAGGPVRTTRITLSRMRLNPQCCRLAHRTLLHSSC